MPLLGYLCLLEFKMRYVTGYLNRPRSHCYLKSSRYMLICYTTQKKRKWIWKSHSQIGKNIQGINKKFPYTISMWAHGNLIPELQGQSYQLEVRARWWKIPGPLHSQNFNSNKYDQTEKQGSEISWMKTFCNFLYRRKFTSAMSKRDADCTDLLLLQQLVTTVP